MSFEARSNTQALVPGLFTYFSGVGGISPYSYLVLPRGIGGSINASTGLYTAPQAYGTDKIQITDSTGAMAYASIMVGSPLQLVCEILQKEIGLEEGQVFLWDQKINIPTDSKLYIAVGVLSCKPFSNNLRPRSVTGSLQADQYASFLATLSIDLLSRSQQANDLKEQVILALNSIYSQSQQEINSFYIAKISTGFANLSQEDGAAIPYRYNISVNMQYCATKIKAVPYYDDFEQPSVATEP